MNNIGYYHKLWLITYTMEPLFITEPTTNPSTPCMSCQPSTSSKDTGVKPGPSKQFKVDNTSKWFNVWFPLNITFITIQSAIRDNNKHIWHVILPLTPHMTYIAYHEQNLSMIIIARWYLIQIAYPEQNFGMINIARWYMIQIAYHEQNFGMINIAHPYIWHPKPYLVIYRYRPSMHQEQYCYTFLGHLHGAI